MSRLLLILTITLLAATAVADEGYVLGVDLQVDDAEGLAATVFGVLPIGAETSISGTLGRSTVDLSQVPDTDSLYADLGIDHRFGLVGISITGSYWGDPDLLDSRDLHGSVYLSGDLGSVGIAFEERDFEFQLPATDFLNRTRFPFRATGRGVNATLNINDDVSVYASGKEYDYSVPFRTPESDRIRPLIVISRNSVLSSLVDWQVSGGIGIDVGEKRLGLDLSKWEGRITGSSYDSITLSFLTPISLRTDMELSLGVNRSELFRDVTTASLRFYYYGGN